MRQQNTYWIVCVVCALAGAVLVLYATDLGVGVSPDSTAYINAARGWLIRFGFPLATGSTSHWVPPGYSMLLAAGGFLLGGLDPFVVARWLGALLFALNIVLVGLMLRFALPGSFSPPLLGMWFMLTSVNMLAVHTMAWSEPPYLFFSLLGLYVLALYLKRPRARWLLLAAACVAVSLLMRYAGLALAATGLVAILLMHGRRGWQRMPAAALFVILSCAPLAVWSLRRSPERVLAWHPMSSEWFLSALPVVAHWFLPAEILSPPAGIGLIVLALVCLGLFIVLAKVPWKVHATTGRALTASRVPGITVVLGFYTLCYALVILVTKLLVDAAVPLDARILAPIYPPALIVLLVAAYRFVSSAAQVTSAKIAVGGLTIAWGVLPLIAASPWLAQSHRDGQWYTSLAWQQSGIMRQVKALPTATSIYSNANDAIAFLTSRPASRLPDKTSADTLLANPAYEADMQDIGKGLSGQSVIVYFGGFEDRWYLPSEQEVVKRWDLLPVTREPDGTIYRRLP